MSLATPFAAAKFQRGRFSGGSSPAAVLRLALMLIERGDLPWSVKEDADSRWVLLRDPAGNLIELAQFKR